VLVLTRDFGQLGLVVRLCILSFLFLFYLFGRIPWSRELTWLGVGNYIQVES
jgi:hypothetical protein